MFNDVIGAGDVFALSAAFDEHFKWVYANTYRDDDSMAVTMRLLVAPRIGDGTEVSSFVYLGYPDGVGMLKEAANSDSVSFVRTRDLAGANLAQDAGEGWREVHDLGRFLSQKTNVRVIQNEGRRMTALVYEARPTLADYHLAQAVISRLMPWYFNDKPLTPKESEYVRSLAGTSLVDYTRAADELAEEMGLMSKFISYRLSDFATYAVRNRIIDLQRSLDGLYDQRQSAMSRYRTLCEQIDEMNIRLMGAREAAASKTGPDEELVSLFLRSKNLILCPTQMRDGALEFIAKGYLTNVDSDMYETYADRPRSLLYNRDLCVDSVFEDMENRKILLDALFSSDATCKLRVCAAYRIDPKHGVEGLERYRYPASCDDSIPNMHIDRYACLGAHYDLIMDRINSGDMVGAVLQCLASAQSQNISEDATMTPLLEVIFGTTRKCIELPDGSSVTPTQALEYLKNGKAGS